MLKRTHLLASVAIALSVAMPAFSQEKPTADTVVATVNGTDITFGHMILARTTLPQQYQSLPNDVLFTGILDQLIQQTALVQSADGAVSTRTKLAIENETRSIQAAEQIDKVATAAITAEAVKTAYDEAYGQGTNEIEYDASHILVETEETAKELVTALQGGADFAELAKEKSTGPSGPSGGKLGWFGKGMMVPEFEQAVVAMESGTVSAPVKTQFGWHVIRLNESRTKDAPTLEQVREEIEATVVQAAIADHLKSLTEAATVSRKGIEDIDPAALSDDSLLEN